eukprot:403350844
MMSDLELAITKLMDIKEEQSMSGSSTDLIMMRDHLIEIYQRIGVGLLKRQQVYDEKLIKQEQEWRATCDKLIEDHQKMREDKEQVESDSKRTIKRLEQQLNELKGEHYSLVRENKEQSEKLNKELQNSINAHLLKNIILKYLTTNEPSVQQNLIRVIIQAMKFSEKDAERIIMFHEENNKSALGKLIGGFF